MSTTKTEQQPQPILELLQTLGNQVEQQIQVSNNGEFAPPTNEDAQKLAEELSQEQIDKILGSIEAQAQLEKRRDSIKEDLN